MNFSTIMWMDDGSGDLSMERISLASSLSFGNLASIALSSVLRLSFLASTVGARSRALLERMTILAIVEVDGPNTKTVYLKNPFKGMAKPAFAEVSRNFNIMDLISNAEIVYQE